ncbi:MAG: glycoside hydrolase family 95 protein [Clostridiaceae bacterium]|nr:glycoside hydrolase family 95 protein [Clostridiaceae bacterium]
MHTSDKLVLKYPASWHGDMWREALPSGNGTVGVAVLGSIKQETVIINHNRLWHWGRKDELPDVGYKLKETRALMDENRFLEASWNLTNALREHGYGTTLEAPMPLADLKITMPCETGFKNYLRELAVDTGEITVAWQDENNEYKRQVFVSRADDIIVCRIRAIHEVKADIELDVHRDERNQVPERFRETAGTKRYEVDSKDGFICYGITHEDGTDCGVVLKVIAGDIRKSGNCLKAESGGDILILAKVFVQGCFNESCAEIRKVLDAIDMDYDTLLERHVNIHRPMFRSVEFQLGTGDKNTCNEILLLDAYGNAASDELVEKMWAYGRYLFISATSPTSLPCNMYGLWHGDYGLIWSHYMANENIQMIYWHTMTGGLIEFNKSLFRYYNERMGEFRENARKLYGCRGIYVPAGTTPGIAYPNQIVPVIMNWTGAAGWLARHYYDYYLYTGDSEFLENDALPFMYETALFYEDFLVNVNGKYKCYPSVSPENTPENFMPEDGRQIPHPMPTTINATMDIVIIKELFSNLIASAGKLGMYEDKIQVWKDILDNLPDYAVNEDGAVKEWIEPVFKDRYDHRHLSHIYPVFPGNEINEENSPELFKAFEIAVNKRKLGAQTGWSLMHMAAIYARFGNGDKALECLDLLAQSGILNNFYTLHNDWRNMGVTLNMREAPIQMDANMGWTNAVQEMLLYNSPRLIKLLPALPKRWKMGKARNWRWIAGTVDFEWNESGFSAVFTACRDAAAGVKIPKMFATCSISVNNSEPEIYSCNELYMMDVKAGDVVRIEGSV